MERKGILILTALVACCFGTAPAVKGCHVSGNASYSTLANSMIAGAMPQQTAQTATGGGQAAVTPDNSASGAGIVGLWQVTVTSSGQVVDDAFEVWHSDGTEMILDITPPAEENACFGVWVQTSRSTFKLKHPSWTFDANGNLTGTAIIRETITLDHSDNKFTGTYTLDYYNTLGQSTGHFTGEVKGSRITVD